MKTEPMHNDVANQSWFTTEKVSLSSDDEQEALSFVRSIVGVDGVPPSPEGERILRLYCRGEIDYETALIKMKRLYSNKAKD